MKRLYLHFLAFLLALFGLLPTRAAEQTQIDVLFVFDKTALDYLKVKSKGPRHAVLAALSEVNEALRSSGLGHVRLASAGFVCRPEFSSATADPGVSVKEGMFRDLQSIYFDVAFKELRNRYNADVVTLFIDNGDEPYNLAGLSLGLVSEEKFRAGTPGERYVPSELNAFTVVQVRELDIARYTYTHEVGHLLGCGHAAEQAAQPGPQYFNDSSGYYIRESEKAGIRAANPLKKGEEREVCLATVMCYEFGVEGIKAPIHNIPLFSSKSLFYTDSGSSRVFAVGDEHCDNAGTIRRLAPLVAAYRQAPAAEQSGVSGPAERQVEATVSEQNESAPEASAEAEPQVPAEAAGPDYTLNLEDILLLVLIGIAFVIMLVSILQLRLLARHRAAERQAASAPPRVLPPWAAVATRELPCVGSCVILAGTLSTGVPAEYRISLEILARQGRFSIGRNAHSDICIPDPTVSSAHAELRLEDNNLYLVDLGSANGTEVNKQRLGRKEGIVLRAGDSITMGIAQFTLK